MQSNKKINKDTSRNQQTVMKKRPVSKNKPNSNMTNDGLNLGLNYKFAITVRYE